MRISKKGGEGVEVGVGSGWKPLSLEKFKIQKYASPRHPLLNRKYPSDPPCEKFPDPCIHPRCLKIIMP